MPMPASRPLRPWVNKGGRAHRVLTGRYYSQRVTQHYVLAEGSYPECRHCKKLVGFRRLKDHLLGKHPGTATVPFGASFEPGKVRA